MYHKESLATPFQAPRSFLVLPAHSSLGRGRRVGLVIDGPRRRCRRQTRWWPLSGRVIADLIVGPGGKLKMAVGTNDRWQLCAYNVK